MKRLLLIVLPLLLIVGCSKPIEDSTLIKKDGLMYSPDSDKPYTGKTFKNYSTGEKLYQGTYENGKLFYHSYYKKEGIVYRGLQNPIKVDLSHLYGPIDPNYDPLIEKNGLMCFEVPIKPVPFGGQDQKKQEFVPYTGEIFYNYKTGEKLYEGTYENGKEVQSSVFNKSGDLKELVIGDITLQEAESFFRKTIVNKGVHSIDCGHAHMHFGDHKLRDIKKHYLDDTLIYLILTKINGHWCIYTMNTFDLEIQSGDCGWRREKSDEFYKTLLYPVSSSGYVGY